MTTGLIWTPQLELREATVAPSVLGLPVTERLHPRDEVWHGYQGSTPHCVAYTWLHWWAARNRAEEVPFHPRELYREARKLMPSPPAEGAVLSAGFRVMHREGLATQMARLMSWEGIREYLVATGPVVIASEWRRGMGRTRMRATGRTTGGHAFLLDGVDGDEARVKNSTTRKEQWLPLPMLDELRWEAWIAT